SGWEWKSIRYMWMWRWLAGRRLQAPSLPKSGPRPRSPRWRSTRRRGEVAAALAAAPPEPKRMRSPTTRCAFLMPDGSNCGAAHMRESTYCFLHDPEHAGEADEARRVGGLRRRRESTLGTAFDLGELDTVGGIRRLLDIVVTDALAADGGVNRQRVLI